MSTMHALALSMALLAPITQSTPPQKPAATTPPASAPQSASRPLLWKVSDADNSIYLLGSFHLLKATDYPLPKDIDMAFNDAEALLFEVSPAEMQAPETLAMMQRYAAYEDGKQLSTVLPKSTYDKLRTLVGASGGSLQAMEKSEPWAISLGMVMGISQAMGFRPELGLDQHLMARADKAGKPVAGLETAEDQMKALDAVPYPEQVQELDEFLADPAKQAKQLNAMHGWWRAGDVARLDSEMRAEMQRKTPQTYRILDVERNDGWLPKLEARLRESTADDTLVVVGALHLLGADGVVEKLRAKGYTVERICSDCPPPAAGQPVAASHES